MSNSGRLAIEVSNLGKMYKLYRNPKDKIKDAFGLNRFKRNYYKEFWALRGVNINIEKGERVGFIGHNGAGKSTLLKIITGNYKPTEGSVRVNGNIQALLEMGTGFHPDFTGRENIRASLAYQGLVSSEISRLEEEIIEFTELSDYIDQPVKTYSAGMYSRLAFATASAVAPELMIIDEVLGAGDAYFNGKCVERMRKLTSEEGVTVLFVSHDLQSIQNLCDRVIWIDKGKVRFDGDVLTGIKLYTQSVRKNEELRLRVRDMKISREQMSALDTMKDLYYCSVFRFKSESNSDNIICKIYKIVVLINDEEIDCIDVGASMDNSMDSLCHIIDESGLTCWGKASVENNYFFRIYSNKYGKDRHAPFQILISKAYAGSKITIKVAYEVLVGKDIVLELFNPDNSEYVKCIDLVEEKNEVVFDWATDSWASENTMTIAEGNVVNDIVETENVQFLDVAVYDEAGEEKNVFSFYDTIRGCRFSLGISERYRHFVIVLIIYSMRGDMILSTCQEVDIHSYSPRIDFVYPMPELKLGPGEYTISIGIYETLDVMDNTREQKFLALFDRALSFKIERPLDYGLNIANFVGSNKLLIDNFERSAYTTKVLI